MADHAKPVITSTYVNFVSELDSRFDDLAVGLDPAVTTATNLPVNSIRWSSSINRWQKWDGTTWGELSTGYTIPLAGPITLDANSSLDALRITQLGTGNALLVEDSSNPDSTPFVIDANGNVIQGTTASTAGGLTGQAYQQHVVAAISGAGALFAGWNATQANAINIARSTSGTVGSFTPSASGTASNIRFLFDDGTQFIRGAEISAVVDGTVGTNDMPGRLVFSTTADGSSSPTVRLTIHSDGSIQAGTIQSPSYNLRLGRNITGATSGGNFYASGTVQSDVTSNGYGFLAENKTAAAAFTLGAFSSFRASQGTFGAGSTVTNQYGFYSDSTLTGATNNYGFYGGIASGTGRYNFYAAGTADNYFAGNVLQGFTSALSFTGPTGTITPTIQAITPASSLTQGIATTTHVSSANGPNIVLGKSRGASASAPTIVSSGDSTGNIVFSAYDGAAYLPTAYIQSFVDGAAGLNDVPGRLVFSTTADGAAAPTERMRIDSSGRVGFGSSALTGYQVRIAGTYGATDVNPIWLGMNGTIPSTATGQAYGVFSGTATAAAAFTLTGLNHFFASQGGVGAGSTVTNQYGFRANSNLTGATNNYGFYSDIATGTGRWNFYANGTASNYFAGSLLLGTTSLRTFDSSTNTLIPTLQVEGITADSSSISLMRNSASTNAAGIFLGKSRSGSNGGVTIVQSGDQLGLIAFEGTDGTGLIEGAVIRAEVDGTPSTNDMPGRLIFGTTADGASSPTERVRIDSLGTVFMRDDTSTTNTYGSRLVVGGTISETVGTTQYLIASQYDVGTAANQIPLNQYLGTMAYQDSASVAVETITASTALTIGKTAVTAPTVTDGNIYSGTYTPTQVSTNTNVSSVTFSACQYLRVGSVVTVSGQVVIVATTATTDTVVKMSLPIASAFSAARQLGGTGQSITTPYGTNTFVCLAETTNDAVEIRLRPSVNTSLAYNFSFTYQII